MMGCGKKKDSDKQLIGFTIFEKSNTIGESQIFDKLNDIDINGVYASDDYSFVSIKGESLFDVKTDTSKLQGDMITPDSICLFINANYYQAQSFNYKMFLYEIFLLNDGKYSVELKTDIQLSSEVGDTNVINFSSESYKGGLSYVFTYKISFQKIETPKEVIVKEFDENNQLIMSNIINQETNEYRVSKDCRYVIIEEKTFLITDENIEENNTDYTFLTEKSQKKNYTFKTLNENNRIINFQVNFLFPKDVLELETKSK